MTRSTRHGGVGLSLVRTLSLAAAALVAGCATAAPPPPRAPVEVVAAAARAQRAGDAAAKRWVAQEAGALELGAIARGVEATPAETGRTATWTRRDRPPVRVVDGRIASGVLRLDHAATPLDAVVLLGRALRARDYGLLTSLLPASERPRWTPATLAEHLEGPVVAEAWAALGVAIGPGTHLEPRQLGPLTAEVAVGASTIRLSREDDGWKVLDIDPADLYAPPLTQGDE